MGVKCIGWKTFYHEIAFNAMKAMEDNILEVLKTFNKIK